MQKNRVLILGLTVILTSCQNNPPSPKADNTEVNVRDREDTLTPADQSEKDSDRRITQKIRQIIIEDSALSQNGKNIKIITIDGVVTLRGPVNNAQEKNNIVNKAKNTPGVTDVNDQIDVLKK